MSVRSVSICAPRTLLARRAPLLRIPRPILTSTPRFYSSPSGSASSQPLANAAVYALGAVGIGSLLYAGYEYYTDWRDQFPEEVRIPLKRGIAARNAGNNEDSVAFKREAWSIARSLPIASFKPPDSYLKLTGIAVDLAGELEESGDINGAYALYTEALDKIRHPQLSDAPPNLLERMRGVQIAVKLGWIVEQAQADARQDRQTAPKLSVSREEEERVRVWAVEEVLRVVMQVQQEKTGTIAEAVDFTTLPGHLPEWLTKTDICVPLVKLGEFYSNSGKAEFAMPLFVQAASLLVGDASASVPRGDLCNGARIFNTIAALVMQTKPTPEGRTIAETWTARSLSAIKIAQTKATPGHPSPDDVPCESALAVALINGGMLREMVGDYKKSKELLGAALKQGKALGMTEGISEIQAAIDRISEKEAKAAK